MRLKIVAAAVVLSIAAGIGLLWWMRERRPVSAQEVLREAAAAGKPTVEILSQQAGQGYYDDAMATARLIEGQPGELAVAVVRIRAENGDIRGATAMAGKNPRAIQAIAVVQARQGDLRSALETSASLPDSDPVLTEYGDHQLALGNFEGALKTAGQVRPSSTAALLRRVAVALVEQGKIKQARELASHMADRKVAAEFLGTLNQQERDLANVKVFEPGPCDVAMMDAQLKKFADAYSLIERNKCWVSRVALEQYPSDPAAAEKALRTTSDSEDLSSGMAGFATAAAKKGSVDEALRFLDEAQLAGGANWLLPKVVLDVAWAMTLKDGPRAALRWARSRPTLSERSSALLGVAEALGHLRPRPAP